MKHGNRYDRHRLCAFAGFDGKTYDALCIPRKAGMVRAEYFVQVDGRSELVTAFLDRHQAKARLTQLGHARIGLLTAFASAVIFCGLVFLVARGFA